MLKKLVKEATVLLFTSILIISTINATANTIQKNTTKNNNVSKILSGTTWYVDDDAAPDGDGSKEHPFKTIKEALEHAESGDTIFVFEGLYKENLVINQSNIALIGEKKESTTIQGSNVVIGSSTVRINGEYVEINNFTIKGGETIEWTIWTGNYSKIRNNIITDGENGIMVAYVPYQTAQYVSITNNIIKNNSKGINIFCSTLERVRSDCIVTNNIISNNHVGIAVRLLEGNIIQDNQILHNKEHGIRVSHSSSNKILENLIENTSGSGIYLLYSSDNTIKGNTISYNKIGIKIEKCKYDTDTLKEDNTFINNENDIESHARSKYFSLNQFHLLSPRSIIRFLSRYIYLLPKFR